MTVEAEQRASDLDDRSEVSGAVVGTVLCSKVHPDPTVGNSQNLRPKRAKSPVARP